MYTYINETRNAIMTKRKQKKIAEALIRIELFAVSAESSEMQDAIEAVKLHQKRYNKAARKLNKLLGFQAITNMFEGV